MTETEIYNPPTGDYISSQVAYTCIHGTVISTVKLPEAYNRYAYETMMYNKDTGIFNDYQQRYLTEEDAIKGHMETIAFMVGYDKETT